MIVSRRNLLAGAGGVAALSLADAMIAPASAAQIEAMYR